MQQLASLWATTCFIVGCLALLLSYVICKAQLWSTKLNSALIYKAQLWAMKTMIRKPEWATVKHCNKLQVALRNRAINKTYKPIECCPDVRHHSLTGVMSSFHFLTAGCSSFISLLFNALAFISLLWHSLLLNVLLFILYSWHICVSLLLNACALFLYSCSHWPSCYSWFMFYHLIYYCISVVLCGWWHWPKAMN